MHSPELDDGHSLAVKDCHSLLSASIQLTRSELYARRGINVQRDGRCGSFAVLIDLTKTVAPFIILRERERERCTDTKGTTGFLAMFSVVTLSHICHSY